MFTSSEHSPTPAIGRVYISCLRIPDLDVVTFVKTPEFSGYRPADNKDGVAYQRMKSSI